MQRFEIDDPGYVAEGPITVEIEGDTICATVHGWEVNPIQEATIEIPEEIRQAWGTIERFSERPGFRIEAGELEYLGDDGKPYDMEPVLKLYDHNVRGGGVVWCLLDNDTIWGTARGNHAVMPDGTILRDGTIEPEALKARRTSLHSTEEARP